MTKETNDEKNSSPQEINRRRFLNRLSVGLGIFGASIVGLPVVTFLLDPIFSRQRYLWRSVGKVSSFKVGTTTQVKMQSSDPAPWAGHFAWIPAWLQRRGEADFVAFSVFCQHLGCPVRWMKQARLFMCPCHGGVYYENGEVAGGPPPRSLQQYPVRIREGMVEVRPGPIPMVEGLWPDEKDT